MKPQVNLGDKVRDAISGFEGVAVAKTEWLNGCVRVTVQPQALHDGKPIDSFTFDVEQMEVISLAEPRTIEPTGGDRPAIGRSPDPR